MNEREHLVPEDQRIHAVLTALGSASPDDGLEQRLARRLAEMPAPQSRPARQWATLRWPLALACGAALLLAVSVTAPSRWHGRGLDADRKGVRSAQRTSTAAGARPRATDAEVVPASTASAKRQPQSQRTVAVTQTRKATPHAEALARAEMPGHEASFPAPPMPLTEQERLLLRVAHRNDPEEIAMLNPVERSLQAARERAQSDRFFAPKPLPPDLQQEINAALRSQYVNTPPPRELLAQTTIRSTP